MSTTKLREEIFKRCIQLFVQIHVDKTLSINRHIAGTIVKDQIYPKQTFLRHTTNVRHNNIYLLPILPDKFGGFFNVNNIITGTFFAKYSE